ncbi:hypothetical protein P153DRAFT_393974 [Dothidotthia symphoricarpi CBS 119687]|uniref:F-box domain-containing protein n=1 Tax=Dothidotthia symphoricarpi CBS 119687 TaxID=1392245 RepID=A0A6A6AM34_9PLEO|nr:uncharacterized protein P153DRAFT_393974 [Dothidotthia symphoricarpi CBS 119687]KAF2133042.1 hypothetical protein P153DRAFT_393974 [Dothidotthia symphoricarpi CBS 119687]
MAHFEHIDDDILFLIFQNLRSERLSSLYCFRLVSQRLKQFAESCLYNTIVLEDTPLRENSSYRLIERLVDSSDTLSRNVRDLQIKSFKGDDGSYCLNSKLLIAALHSLHKLDSFSWDCNIPLPDELLSTLSQLYPRARLCATARSLDEALLSSSQLHTLSISVPCADAFHPETEARLGELRHVLLRSRNLRVLILNIHRDHSLWKLQEEALTQSLTQTATGLDNKNLDIHKIQIPLEPGDRLPALEYLAIDARTYSFDKEHCLRLIQCMDARRLKRLRIASSSTEHFFEAFTHKTPQLEILEFDTHWTWQSSLNRYIATSVACSRFITSIVKLKEVVVYCNATDSREPFWTALAETHGSHLQRLSIQTRNEGLELPYSDHKRQAPLSCFPSLTSLEMVMHPWWDNSSCSDCLEGRRHWLNTCYIGEVPVLPLLTTIQISFKFSFKFSFYETPSFHSHVVRHAHCAIRRLWSMYTNDKAGHHLDHKLERVSMRFWRWEPPPPHPDENGVQHTTRVHEIIFDSKMIDEQLLIWVRNRKDLPMRRCSTARH